MQVFIIISGLGAFWAYFFLPETRGVPLEEIAAIFGDADEVMVFSEDIHIDRGTHELVVEQRGVGSDGGAVARIATEAGVRPSSEQEKAHVAETEMVHDSANEKV